MENSKNNTQSSQSCVISRYLFWFESKGREKDSFEIEAKNPDEAFDKAYNIYGEQVKDMLYQKQS